MKKTIELVSADDSMISRSDLRESAPFQAASTRAPAQPTPAASVGVAHPRKIEPSTSETSSTGGKKLRTIIAASAPAPLGPSSAGIGGAISGFRKEMTPIQMRYSTESSRPGNKAPANSDPTGTDIRSPMITSMIEGGIRMPSVPEDAIVPTASSGW